MAKQRISANQVSVGTAGFGSVLSSNGTVAYWSTNTAINGPLVSAFSTNATSLISGSWTKIGFDTLEYDSSNSFTISTSRFQPTIPGWYQINSNYSVSAYAANTGAQLIAVYKNSIEFKRGNRIPATTVGTGTTVASLCFFDGLTQYTEIWGLQSSGSTVSTESGSDFGPIFSASFIKPSNVGFVSNVAMLIIGGGGAGGSNWGGGGGGGGYEETTNTTLIKGATYTITVGQGGLANTTGTGYGANGANSSVIGPRYSLTDRQNLIAVGGGGGGYNINASTAANGQVGGQGGGGGYPGSGSQTPGGSGTGLTYPEFVLLNFQNSGGLSNTNLGSGGGGGAGGAGSPGGASTLGGNGGAGKQSSITGSAVYYSAGGGGGGSNATRSSGGTGNGGGAGGSVSNGQAGANGAGYGMGGGGGATSSGVGGNGSNGVVIISVPTIYFGTPTGTYSNAVNGSNTVITWTANGTYIA
jgi:hypothetical protein